MEDNSCPGKIGETHEIKTSVSWVFWVVLVVALLGISIALGLLLRKRLKKDMDKEIKMQVSTAVDHYFALTENSVTQ